MTPRDGMELQECLRRVHSGGTILLQPNTIYHEHFILAQNNVTLRGADGSTIVGKAEKGVVLRVLGNSCTVDKISCTGVETETCVQLDGCRCSLTSINLRDCALDIPRWTRQQCPRRCHWWKFRVGNDRVEEPV